MDKKISLLRQAQKMGVDSKHQSTYGGSLHPDRKKNIAINSTHYRQNIDGDIRVLCSVNANEDMKVTANTSKLTCPFCLSILLSSDDWPDGERPIIH